MMKNLIVIILAAFTLSSCGKKSEGWVIEYKMTYTEVPPEMQAYINFMPKKKIIYIKDDKVREEKPIGVGMQIMIMDSAKFGDRLLLMEMGDRKMMTEIPGDYYQQMAAEFGEEKITYKEDTKEFSGYTCTKAQALNKNYGKESTIYYTNDIPAWGDKTFGELNGFPLYYEATSEGLYFVVEAVKVERKQLNDDLFSGFDGYEMMSMEEMQMALSEGY